ncbi:hypothetical protein UFOVP214_1, partial [uncultured Caudovirales phage]
LIINNLATNINAIQALQRVETPAACLTLTRSATLAITTAGTIITWQAETRNNGITWSGTTITIPTSGYYGISSSVTATANFSTWFVLNVNGVAVSFMATDSTAVTHHSAYYQRYFTTGDTVTLSLFPNINTTLSVIAEGVANESPILHIVQLTGSQS